MSAFNASDPAAVTSDERVLRAAVAAYLGRYRGQSRLHTGSDLKIYLTWCTDQDLDPLRVARVDIERYALVAGDPLLPTLYRLPPSVGRRRLLPSLRHRPGPALLAGRLRTPTTGTRRVTDPWAGTSAVRGVDQHRATVAEHQRLRPDCHARSSRP